ncbi:MAG: hypothetical protein ACOCUU_00345 [Nanoarchaeota archaeon]
MNFNKKNNKKKEESQEKKQSIQASIIIEVLGKPPEHLNETLKDLISKIKQEKGVEVINEKVNSSSELKNKPGFYTNFAEIELELESIIHLNILMFKYMPAHIEIISPENIVLSNKGWNDFLNELTRRLHRYDEVARTMKYENQIMRKKLEQLLPNKSSKNKDNKKI